MILSCTYMCHSPSIVYLFLNLSVIYHSPSTVYLCHNLSVIGHSPSIVHSCHSLSVICHKASIVYLCHNISVIWVIIKKHALFCYYAIKRQISTKLIEENMFCMKAHQLTGARCIRKIK